MAGFRFNTMVAVFICALIVACSLLAFTVCEAKAAGNATATPVNNTTISPTPVVTPTPTPAQRQVFFDTRWDTDHVSVQVNNNGPAIKVEASIGSLSNLTTTQVAADSSVRVLTQGINAKNGDIVRYWFKAYDGNTLIDSMEGTVQVEAKATIAPETAIVSGTVVNSITGTPISGAEVTFVPRDFEKTYPSTFTDSSGVFTTIGKMSPGTYYLTIKANGFKTLTGIEVPVSEGQRQISEPIRIEPIVIPSPTATPGPTSSPTPGSPLDAWINLLYNPTVCISTLALALGAIVSATAIYEWTLRQRERRKKEEEKKKGENN